MSETIYIEIDDSQLDAVLAKVAAVDTAAAQLFGGGAGGMSGKRLDRVLPSINRDLRLILGQVRGMPDLMQKYFAYGLRPERGYAYYKDWLAGGKKDASSLLQAGLVAAAVILQLYRDIKKWHDDMEQAKRDYEYMVRRARGWTYEEFVKGTKEWENYLRGIPP